MDRIRQLTNWIQLIEETNDTPVTTDKIKEINPTKLYNINHNSLLMHAHSTESQINIFTDGNLTAEHAGSVYTIQY